MKKINSASLSLIAVVALSAIPVPVFCDSNPYHVYAMGALTMYECLECHCGAPGPAVTICIGTECRYKKVHPLMQEYPPSQNFRDFAGADEVQAAGCLLEDGKVTCLSCHDLTKPAPHLVRAEKELCATCHIAASHGRHR